MMAVHAQISLGFTLASTFFAVLLREASRASVQKTSANGERNGFRRQ